jgi:ATP-dependent Lon protease
MSNAGWKAPLPLQVMMHRRWDAAFEFLYKLSLPAFPSAPVGWLELTRSDDRKSQRQSMLDVIETAFLAKNVEMALAWSFLAADPSSPETLMSFLPQVSVLLERAVDEGVYVDGEHELVRETLNVWMDAAAGKYTEAQVSVFAIAARLVRSTVGPDAFELLRSAAEKRADAVEEVSDAAGLVVMPKDKSTKLLSELSHFKDLVGKKLPLVMAADVDQVRATLRAEYPHAGPAIDLLTKDLRTGQPIRMKPVILLGDPGSGKSRLARRLADIVADRSRTGGVGMFLYRFDASSVGDSLSWAGTARGWGNSTPSVPARAVQQSQQPNVFVLAEELDKSGRGWNGSIYSAMTPFLERDTAKRLRDISLDAELDLSWVSYIATANDDTKIPDHIRDRFRIVRVPLPGLQHLRALAVNIMRDLAAEADVDPRWMAPLDADEEAVVAKAWTKAGMSIRKLQKIIAATLEARDAYAPRQ